VPGCDMSQPLRLELKIYRNTYPIIVLVVTGIASGEEVIDEAVLRVPGRFRNGKAEIRRFESLALLVAAMLQEKYVLKWLKG
jgi:hypothetical protein